MTSIVTISTTEPVEVTSERISEDGRERHPNGVDVVVPGNPQQFIVHPGQSLRVVELPPEAPAPTAEIPAQES
jgi:hypothetical protein